MPSTTSTLRPGRRPLPGLTGDRAGEPTVASPLLKQVFSLRTGAALDDPEVAIPTYAVRVQHGTVRIGLPLP